MKFFNVDLHISVIADMKKIFGDLGHKVFDMSLSDHTWVFNRRKDSIPMLDNGRWMHISAQDYEEEFFSNFGTKLNAFDAFIVTYPPTFVNLYKQFDKPIIVNIPIRYEWPFSFKSESWEKTNDFIQSGYKSGQIKLVANNLYDKFYTEQFLDVEVQHIPSLCDYNQEYHSKTKKEFVYYSKSKLEEIDSSNFIFKSDLGNHKYKDLISHSGIVHFPYCPSYMSVFEQYTSNTPLLFPTQEFLFDMFKKGYQVMGESSWYFMNNMGNKSMVKPITGIDPNDYMDDSIIKKWIELSDFYDNNWMPHITYFNNFEELNDIKNNFDSDSISNEMKKFNIVRKEQVYKLWENLLKNIK